MAAIIRRLKAKSTKQLYQEAEGLLNDISKSEEHLGADSLRWDMPDWHTELRKAYRPAEPATSSMDIALRVLAFHRHGAEYIEDLSLYFTLQLMS
jgi:hypothetical protein